MLRAAEGLTAACHSAETISPQEGGAIFKTTARASADSRVMSPARVLVPGSSARVSVSVGVMTGPVSVVLPLERILLG